MAQIITRKDCTLSEANAFYRIEASNPSYASNSTANGAALSSVRTIPLTFANAGNFKGVVLALSCSTVVDRSVTVKLQEYVGSTWTDRVNQTISWATMTCNISSAYKHNGMYWINFDNFSGVQAVDTTASKWRLSVQQTGGSAGTIYLIWGYDATTYHYWAYCDTQISFTNGDTVVWAHYCEIDQTANFNSILGTGDTTYGVAGVICSNTVDATPDNVAFLKCTSPAAAYTLTINGIILMNGHAGFRAGTASSPIAPDKALTIILNTATVGTVKSSFRTHTNASSTSYHYSSRPSFFLYGSTTLTKLKTTLTAKASVGANTLTVAEDMSTYGWGNGDIIGVGKQDVMGQGATATYTIQSISGTTITLTGNIATNDRLSGGTVVNLTGSKFGIIFKSNNSTAATNYLVVANNVNIEGCYIENVLFSGANAYYYADDDTGNTQKMTFKNCSCLSTGTGTYYFMYTIRINDKGYEADNLVGWRCLPIYTMTGYRVELYKSGAASYSNISMLSKYTGYFGHISKSPCTLINNITLENSNTNYDLAFNVPPNSAISNVSAWGSAVTGSYGTVCFTGQCIGSTFSNITVDKCNYGVLFNASAIVLNNTFTNFNLGVESANTYDYTVNAGALVDSVFKNCEGWDTRLEDDLTEATDGTNFRFVNYEDTANNDKVLTPYGRFQRCGDSLDDTTVHTSGTGKFSIRFENTLPGTPLEWTSVIPTGDISGKDMAISVWCKINSANYYSGTYTMPKLVVHYDNDASTVTATAAETTDWQLLTVPFTPATSSGDISVTLSSDTDQTGSDAYVYFDDATVFYPAGVLLSLGGLDIWSKGYPITPFISTGINPNDVWAVQKSTQTTAGSMGKTLVDCEVKADDATALILGR